MATYKRYYKNDILLGTGTYKYRPYTVLTPTVALTFHLTGCSTTATSANRLGETIISFTKSAGYNWPTTVQVTGATMVSWDHNTGVLVIEKPTLNTVTIAVACTKITYSITENLTNVTATGTHPTSIEYGGSVTLVYAADTNYKLPDTVTVTGATHTWASGSGTLTLSNPTGAVTITIAGVASSSNDIPAGNYVFNNLLDFSHVHVNDIKQQLSFVCNGKEYTAMEVLPIHQALNFYYIDDDGMESWSVVYNDNTWASDSYKEFSITQLQQVDPHFKEFILLNSIS